jgi:xylan 1,4-beta-xylosidase
MDDFLEHCLRGKNFATGKTGSPLDFVAFHAKGARRSSTAWCRWA